MKRISMERLLAAIGLFGLAACAAAASTTDDLSSGTVLTVASGGVERKLIAHARPDGMQQPLILIFHGGGGAQSMARRTRSFANQLLVKGYVVALMNGSSRRGGQNLRTWNGGHCCGYAMTAGVNEVDYIDKAIAAIAARTALDKSRIFLMGHSNGGMVSYRSPADMQTPVRGIVVISSAMFDDQPPIAQGISAFLTHARDDDNIAFDASFEPKHKRAWNATPLPFRQTESRMAHMLGCGSPERQSEAGGIARRNRNCAEGADMTVVVSATGGHEWPKSIPGFSLEDAILEFLDRQR